MFTDHDNYLYRKFSKTKMAEESIGQTVFQTTSIKMLIWIFLMPPRSIDCFYVPWLKALYVFIQRDESPWVLNYGIVVSEFKLHSLYYDHFRIYTLGER